MKTIKNDLEIIIEKRTPEDQQLENLIFAVKEYVKTRNLKSVKGAVDLFTVTAAITNLSEHEFYETIEYMNKVKKLKQEHEQFEKEIEKLVNAVMAKSENVH